MINQATVNLIKEFEGFRAKAYKCPAGVWTIGYGITAAAHVGIIPHEGMTISEDEAEKYLYIALHKFSNAIKPAITRSINDNEFGAFVSLAYNIGSGAFKKSSALRHFNAGETQKSSEAILMWNKAGGKVLAGLTRRRAAERTLFLTPVGFVPQAETHDSAITPDVPRDNAIKSTTIQAGVIQAVSAVGAGASAMSALNGTAQIVALIFCGIIALAAVWIMRERLRKWSDGDR